MVRGVGIKGEVPKTMQNIKLEGAVYFRYGLLGWTSMVVGFQVEKKLYAVGVRAI